MKNQQEKLRGILKKISIRSGFKDTPSERNMENQQAKRRGILKKISIRSGFKKSSSPRERRHSLSSVRQKLQSSFVNRRIILRSRQSKSSTDVVDVPSSSKLGTNLLQQRAVVDFDVSPSDGRSLAPSRPSLASTAVSRSTRSGLSTLSLHDNLYMDEGEEIDPKRTESARSLGVSDLVRSVESGEKLDEPEESLSKNRFSASESSRIGLNIISQGSQRKRNILLSWATKLRRQDPRYQILEFFHYVANDGSKSIDDFDFSHELITPVLKSFYKASVFTVWRPCSFEAIRRMMLGEGVGKGLDIKGKSAQRGKLSGFVPFLQLHLEQHKTLVHTLPKEARIRVFFSTQQARDEALDTCTCVAEEMLLTVGEAQAILADESSDDFKREEAYEKLVWDMSNPCIYNIDDYGPNSFGLDLSQRLFWEAFVTRRDCNRKPGSELDTGRPSEPAFQDMNLASLRSYKDGKPRAVVFQYSDEDPMCPQHLLMAYEDRNRVLPVVSDFDCFLVGSRGVSFEEQLPMEQVSILKAMVSQVESILDSPPTKANWTSRWLEGLKKGGTKTDVQNQIPEYGFGDPKSYSIMERAIRCLSKDGSVRHGAECFNYYFPQEVDKSFLVISDTGIQGKLPWKYMKAFELQDFLSRKVDEGFTFPLNPKWVLCDPGWKRVYDRLFASKQANVQESLDIWYPPASGIREQIESISARHPKGFCRDFGDGIAVSSTELSKSKSFRQSAEFDNTAAMDLAELELKNYLTLQRAKRKLRVALFFIRLHRECSTRREVEKTMLANKAKSKIRSAVFLLKLKAELGGRDISEELAQDNQNDDSQTETAT